ncbi:hypothetical protein PROFUN_00699 [Planoprotostelium fungivorum]|uniref:Uncharacterized protein n=1 Tax=Planoprotostelium fungivorum TaxID=1890364 RepID=A0A2P6NUE9_9EUKA|nr:hypothetical protein PROFUN_00699 [Planoprotostelium fungivorum]
MEVAIGHSILLERSIEECWTRELGARRNIGRDTTRASDHVISATTAMLAVLPAELWSHIFQFAERGDRVVLSLLEDSRVNQRQTQTRLSSHRPHENVLILRELLLHPKADPQNKYYSAITTEPLRCFAEIFASRSDKIIRKDSYSSVFTFKDLDHAHRPFETHLEISSISSRPHVEYSKDSKMPYTATHPNQRLLNGLIQQHRTNGYDITFRGKAAPRILTDTTVEDATIDVWYAAAQANTDADWEGLRDAIVPPPPQGGAPAHES